MVADLNKEIVQKYDVLLPAGKALRGLFLIDKEGIVKHQIVNDLSLGRNIQETLRLLDALQFTEKHGKVCPANWKQGEEGMKETSEGVAGYLADHAKEL